MELLFPVRDWANGVLLIIILFLFFYKSHVMHFCVSEQPKVTKSDGQSGKQIHIPNLLG